MRWTEEQLADHLAKSGLASRSPPVRVDNPPFKPPANPASRFALGRLKTGEMNKTEAAYAAHLADLQHAGEILWFKFEGVKVRLADNTFYTPDFGVLHASGVFELHEVKGFLMEDANVKIKVAASMYPFRFVMVRARAKKLGGGWTREEY
jgi:hypothetical protein